MLILIFFALGATEPRGNLYDEESNKYLSKLGRPNRSRAAAG